MTSPNGLRQKALMLLSGRILRSGLKSNRGALPSINDVLDIFRKLPHAQGKLAEEYIRKAPPQIDTEYRKRIVKEFGWFPQ